MAETQGESSFDAANPAPPSDASDQQDSTQETVDSDDLKPTERLTHIIDDTDGREEAVKWTENQLLAGASFEVVAAELVSQGWAAVSADSIVEEAREATRRQRGVRTRDDVVVGVYRKFRKSMRRVRWLLIIGIVVVMIVISMMFNRGP